MFFGDLILKIEKTATCNQLKNIKNSKIKAVFWISIKCKLKEIPKHQDLSVQLGTFLKIKNKIHEKIKQIIDR